MTSSSQPIIDLRLGTDIVHIPRLTGAYLRFGSAFFERILTEGELGYCRNAHITSFLDKAAGRIAIKEAVSKALGTGMNGLGWGEGVAWKDIEVQSKPKAMPGLVLHGSAQQRANELSIAEWRITLSHDGDYATATVAGLIR